MDRPSAWRPGRVELLWQDIPAAQLDNGRPAGFKGPTAPAARGHTTRGRERVQRGQVRTARPPRPRPRSGPARAGARRGGRVPAYARSTSAASVTGSRARWPRACCRRTAAVAPARLAALCAARSLVPVSSERTIRCGPGTMKPPRCVPSPSTASTVVAVPTSTTQHARGRAGGRRRSRRPSDRRRAAADRDTRCGRRTRRQPKCAKRTSAMPRRAAASTSACSGLRRPPPTLPARARCPALANSCSLPVVRRSSRHARPHVAAQDAPGVARRPLDARVADVDEQQVTIGRLGTLRGAAQAHVARMHAFDAPAVVSTSSAPSASAPRAMPSRAPS